jgi:hypothetical protein
MSTLRNALFLQAAVTALVGLTGSAGLGWTLLTMVVAAGAVFVGAALQPTPAMRTGLLGFEAAAVVFGLLGLTAGHVVPATLLGLGVLALVLTGEGVRAFAGPPEPAPAWIPPTPVAPEAPVVVDVPVAVAPVVPAARASVSSMTVLPGR